MPQIISNETYKRYVQAQAILHLIGRSDGAQLSSVFQEFKDKHTRGLDSPYKIIRHIWDVLPERLVHLEDFKDKLESPDYANGFLEGCRAAGGEKMSIQLLITASEPFVKANRKNCPQHLSYVMVIILG